MKLSEVCIERPVLSWVLTLIIIVVGFIGWTRLSLQESPSFSKGAVEIQVSLPGAGPEIIEMQITRVIEDGVASLEGVETVTSVSSPELSKVNIEFDSQVNIDFALNNIRDVLTRIKPKLPPETTEFELSKARSDDKSVINFALTSGELSIGDVADYAHNFMKKDLESLPGVSKVEVIGAGLYTMKIYLDPMKMASYNVSTQDVAQALKRQNIEKPGGRLITKDREYLITTLANMESPEEFENLIIKSNNNAIVRVRDIGRAEISSDDGRTRSLFNGKPSILVAVYKQSMANPIEVSNGARKLYPEFLKSLPKNITLDFGLDRTLTVKKSLDAVYATLIEAIMLVVLVVFLFLRSMRASIIPLVTIPISLIGSFFFMYLLGFSINNLTLLAIVLAIGLVVDDAIIVLENVYQHLEKGLKPFQATIMAVREISFTVIATTLTLAAVYAPISFAKGKIGQEFTEFSLTLTAAVLISGFAALTLSPMMCARLLRLEKGKKKHADQAAHADGVILESLAISQSESEIDLQSAATKHKKAEKTPVAQYVLFPTFDSEKISKNKKWFFVLKVFKNIYDFTVKGKKLINAKIKSIYKNAGLLFVSLKKDYPIINDLSKLSKQIKKLFWSEKWLEKLEHSYSVTLKKWLVTPYKIAGVGILFSLVGVVVYINLPKEQKPAQDKGLIVIRGVAPQSSNIEYTGKYINEIEKILGGVKDIEMRQISVINPTFDIYLFLKTDRKKSTQNIIDYLKDKTASVTGVRIMDIQDAGASSKESDAKTVEFVLQGHKSFKDLKEHSIEFASHLRRAGIFTSIRTQIQEDAIDYIITVEREKASTLNIEPATIGEVIETFMRGRKTGTFKYKNNMLYDVKIEADDFAHHSIDDILNLYIEAGDRNKTLVPLSELVTIQTRLTPLEIARYNRMRSCKMYLSLEPSAGIREGVETVKQLAAQYLPSDVFYTFTDDTKDFLNDQNTIYLIFALALIFIYLVMAAQFESWRDPFIIILSVPLSLSGGIIAISLIKNGSINIYSQIGLVTLIGLITKHGIMMVDFANQLRSQGHGMFDAILLSSQRRLRPILMTTFAMVLGSIPLALAMGVGSETRRQIGWVIVGGMSIGTVFTLFVVPAFYLYLAKKDRKTTGSNKILAT